MDRASDFYDAAGPDDLSGPVLDRRLAPIVFDAEQLREHLPMPDAFVTPPDRDRPGIWADPCWAVLGGVAWPSVLMRTGAEEAHALAFDWIGHFPAEISSWMTAAGSGDVPDIGILSSHTERDPVDIGDIWSRSAVIGGLVWRDRTSLEIRVAAFPVTAQIRMDDRVPPGMAWSLAARMAAGM